MAVRPHGDVVLVILFLGYLSPFRALTVLLLFTVQVEITQG